MEIILIITALSLLIGFIFIIVEKPFFLVSLLIFMMVYVFNLPVPGPLDARGLLLLIIFTRIVFFDKDNLSLVNNYLFKNKYFGLVIVFILLTTITTYINAESLKVALKNQILSFMSVILGFLVLSDKRGRNAFILGLLAVGLVSVFDLVVHYVKFDGRNQNRFTILRLLDLLSTGEDLRTNHNTVGMLAGITFIFVYLNHFHKNWKKIYTVPLMIILGSGVFLSTSRSAVISVFLIVIYISFSSGNIKSKLNKIIVSAVALAFIYATFYLSYNLIIKNSALENNLIKGVYFRLYEEPLHFFGAGTKVYNKYSGESRKNNLDFRLEKASRDINKFSTKDIFTQSLGYGKGGYENFGEKIFIKNSDKSSVLSPHNGYIMLLVEHGIVGLIIYLIFAIGLIVKSIKTNKERHLQVPVFYIYLMLMIYVIAQNGELTNSLSFLLIGGMIANLLIHEEETEHEHELDYRNSRELGIVKESS